MCIFISNVTVRINVAKICAISETNDLCQGNVLWRKCDQAPVPLTIFRSNSKLDQNLPCSG